MAKTAPDKGTTFYMLAPGRAAALSRSQSTDSGSRRRGNDRVPPETEQFLPTQGCGVTDSSLRNVPLQNPGNDPCPRDNRIRCPHYHSSLAHDKCRTNSVSIIFCTFTILGTSVCISHLACGAIGPTGRHLNVLTLRKHLCSLGQGRLPSY